MKLKKVTVKRHLRKVRKSILKELVRDSERYDKELLDKHFGEIIMRMVESGTLDRCQPGDTVTITYRISMSDEYKYPHSHLNAEVFGTAWIPQNLIEWLKKNKKKLSPAKIERIVGGL